VTTATTFSGKEELKESSRRSSKGKGRKKVPLPRRPWGTIQGKHEKD